MNRQPSSDLSLDALNNKLWKRAAKPLFEQLMRSDKDDLSEHDVFAWLLQQAGHLKRGEIEKAEIATIIALFIDQANQTLREGRIYCRHIMRDLLVLCAAPDNPQKARPSLLDNLRSNRFLMQTLLGDSPSITLFVRDMIRYEWIGARNDAIFELSHSSTRFDAQKSFPEDNPWSVAEILGFDPFDKSDFLIDPKAVPRASFQRLMKHTSS